MPLTDLDWLRIGEDFPPVSEKARLDKYADNRKLWDGKQTEVYDEWYRILREEYGVSHEIVFNFHKLLSTLWSELTFGDAPVFDAGDAPEGSESNPAQDAIDRIVETSQFVTAGREAVIDDSRYGDALFKLRLKSGRAFIQAQSSAVWFPVVALDDQREVTHHVLAWTFEKDEVTYLRVEIHERGFIENRLFTVKGGVIDGTADLAQFFPDRKKREETRLDDFMVLHVPGLRASDEFFGKDDYEDIDSLVLERMVRMAQLSRIQDTHSDPNMYGDAEMIQANPVTGRSEFEGGGKFLPVQPDGVTPGYLTWDARQDAQFKFMEVLKQDLYEVSKTTPTAFGASATGFAESGTSVRLRMIPPLAKARDIRSRFDPVVKKALILAATLEKVWGVEGAAVPEAINITWKDGLPSDPKEQQEIEASRLASGNTSRYASVRRMDGGTDDGILEEIERIEEERAVEDAMPEGLSSSPASMLDDLLNGGTPNGADANA